MEISGMDAAKMNWNPPTNTDAGTAPKNTKEKTSPAENIAISQMKSQDIAELPVSDQVVIKAIERANKAITGANTKFEFSIHKQTKQIMIKIIDTDTNETIREIPPEKVLDMVARLWEMSGIVVDEKR